MAKNRILFSNDFVLKNERVGINTTDPQALLDVGGELKVSGVSTFVDIANFDNNVNIAGTVGIGTVVDIIAYDTLSNGTLSFEGSAGQLFSITNNLTSGSIFSVNDVSGIPSIDVDADGTIQLAPYGSTEYVGVGKTNPTQKLDVAVSVKIDGGLYDSNNSRGNVNEILVSIGSGIGVTWKSLTAGDVAGAVEVSSSSSSTPYYIIGTEDATGVTSSFYSNVDIVYTGDGRLGIGTTNPTYKLQVVGDFGATTKSFVIPHPTKPGMTLRHGALEGDELAVYVRGKTTESIISLPDYWTGLVDEETITINLTPKNGKLHSVVGISSNTVEVECMGGEVDCYFMILGERKDVDKLIVEY